MPAGMKFLQLRINPRFASMAQRGWRGPCGEDFQDRVVVQLGTKQAFDWRVDLSEQAADAVAGLSDLPDQVLIETDEHAQRCFVLVKDLEAASGMRQGAGGVNDNEGVFFIGLRRPRIHICDASYGQPKQVGHRNAEVLSDGNSEGSDGGGLVHDDQDSTLSYEVLVVRDEFYFVVGQILFKILDSSLVTAQTQ